MKNKKQVNKPELNQIRKNLRNRPTPWEHKLWQHLKGKKLGGFKFRRQVSIDNYVVDFLCVQPRVIVELDGSGHLAREQKRKDLDRQKDLEDWGYTVMRFLNTAIDENLEYVLNEIHEKCQERNEIWELIEAYKKMFDEGPPLLMMGGEASTKNLLKKALKRKRHLTCRDLKPFYKNLPPDIIL